MWQRSGGHHRPCPQTVNEKVTYNKMKRTWKSKKDRRDAAVVFLQRTINDPDVRSAVLKDRKAAHRIFEHEGAIDIPDDVEVICIGPSTQERDRLVVFVLPSEDTPTEHLDALKYWVAAWQPYFDPVMIPSRREQEVTDLPLPILQ
jgi:hypothetical protein